MPAACLWSTSCSRTEWAEMRRRAWPWFASSVHKVSVWPIWLSSFASSTEGRDLKTQVDVLFFAGHG